MKKTVISLLLVLAAATVHAQFLFRVSGGDLQEPSFILGTIHILSGDQLDSIPAFLEAEAQCKQFYTELENTKSQSADVMQNLMGKALENYISADGKSIYDLLDKTQINLLTTTLAIQTNAMLKATAEVRERSGMPARSFPNEAAVKSKMEQLVSQLQICKPFFFTNLIEGFLNNEVLMRSLKKDITPDQLIDRVCVFRAKARGMAIGELDEIQDIKSDMTASVEMDISRQADSLVAYLNNFASHRQEVLDGVNHIRQTMEYWGKGDFQSFAEMPYWKKEMEKALPIDKRRNETWLPKIEDAMRKAPTMFVFGAAHLIGPYSIIQKLRDAGYEVTQVGVK